MRNEWVVNPFSTECEVIFEDLAWLRPFGSILLAYIGE